MCLCVLRVFKFVNFDQFRDLKFLIIVENIGVTIYEWHKENSAFAYSPNIPYNDDEIINIGPMSVICEYCRALKYKSKFIVTFSKITSYILSCGHTKAHCEHICHINSGRSRGDLLYVDSMCAHGELPCGSNLMF